MAPIEPLDAGEFSGDGANEPDWPHDPTAWPAYNRD